MERESFAGRRKTFLHVRTGKIVHGGGTLMRQELNL